MDPINNINFFIQHNKKKIYDVCKGYNDFVSFRKMWNILHTVQKFWQNTMFT